jgi:hypothetical protein
MKPRLQTKKAFTDRRKVPLFMPGIGPGGAIKRFPRIHEPLNILFHDLDFF